MTVHKTQYEELLSTYCDASAAIALLRQFRPYLELLPSMRRPHESVITIPLPVVKLQTGGTNNSVGAYITARESITLPCDLAILMCDPEWKIKTGAEIFIFIHRPHEDFSELLSRWRQTQVWLSQGYEWEMPPQHRHILNEGVEHLYPLFVLLNGTPDRIKRGLKGAFLPFVTCASREDDLSPAVIDSQDPKTLWLDQQDN